MRELNWVDYLLDWAHAIESILNFKPSICINIFGVSVKMGSLSPFDYRNEISTINDVKDMGEKLSAQLLDRGAPQDSHKSKSAKFTTGTDDNNTFRFFV